MEVIIGHLSFCFLLRREFLSILSAVYGFARKATGMRMTLWSAVRRELRWAVAVLPLAYRKLDARWHGRVVATDASPSGLGAVHCEKPLSEVSQHGRVNERWRYQRGQERAAQARLHAGMKVQRSHAARETSRDLQSHFCGELLVEEGFSNGGVPPRII